MDISRVYENGKLVFDMDIVYVYGDNDGNAIYKNGWNALYKNGLLVDQYLEKHPNRLLDSLGIPFKILYIDWFEPYYVPDYFSSNIPKTLRQLLDMKP